MDGSQQADTILPLAGDDRVRGLEGSDRIDGDAGNDFLNGNQDNDTVLGGEGNDSLRGGKQDDGVFGGDGDDSLLGDLGNDTLDGNAGSDRLFGGNGSPLPIGAIGERDSLVGGEGNDFLQGNEGRDTLRGGGGRDTIRGGKDDDFMEGGDGRDRILGDLGADTLVGGGGADTFVIGRRSNVPGFRSTGGPNLADADVVLDFVSGGDTIELIGGLTVGELNVFQGSGDRAGDTILQDRITGEFLAILVGIDRDSVGTDGNNRLTFAPTAPAPVPAPAPAPSPTPTPANVPPVANDDTSGTSVGNAVTLNLTANDTDSDGAIVPGSVAIATGPSNGSVTNNGDGTVTYTPNALFVGTDTFAYTVGDDGGATSNIATATVSVLAGPSFSIDSATITETDAGTTNATFTVTLSAVQAGTVTVDFATAASTAIAGADYSTTSGTLTFPSGTTAQTVTVPIQGDLLDEDNEQFLADLSNPTAGIAIAIAQGVGTIVDNDPLPDLTVNDVTLPQPATGTANATFSVSLSAASGRTVTVDFATADGTAIAPGDYTAASGTLTFPAGTTTQTIAIEVQSPASPAPATNGEIRGAVWEDADSNGVREVGETGLPGVTVFLDANQNGALDGGEISVATDVNGDYAFTNLTPGDYTVVQQVPSGATQTFPQINAVSAIDFIPVADRRDLVFDPTRDLLYITTSAGNIERYNVTTNTLLSAWNVGTELNGADITPDGTSLYVAEGQTVGSEGFLLEVDLGSGSATSIPYTRVSLETGAWDVAIASDGTGFFTTQFGGSGWNPLRQFDLATNALTERNDSEGSGFGGRVRQNTHVARSADRNTLYFAESNISSGPTFTYDATIGDSEAFSVNLSNATNASISDGTGIGTIQLDPFPAQANTSASLSNSIARASRDGSFTAVEVFPENIRIFDSDLNLVDTLTGFDGGFGFDPARDILYAIDTDADEIVAHDLETRNELYRFAVGENISGAGSGISSNFGSGNFAFTPDGDLMFLSTPTGVRVYDLPDLGNHGVVLGSGQTLSGIDFGNFI